MESQEQPKKCFCSRCFTSIGPDDKIEVEGQSFHRMCGMCCICRKIPESLKMFYGHVFCTDCFDMHVMSHFKGEVPKVRTDSWWMQWNPCMHGQSCSSQASSEAPKHTVCSRCRQIVDDKDSINIGGQAFHSHCARCYYCQTVPKTSVKVYYGQVFCEECFHKHVMQQNKDNPANFFKNCFDQWQSSPQFAESMKDFMGSSASSSPFVFLMQAAGSRCAGEAPAQPFQPEPKKSATTIFTEDTPEPWDLNCDVNDSMESTKTTLMTSFAKETAEKIAKLTCYLSDCQSEENAKKWENFSNPETKIEGWVDLQDSNKCVVQKCPKCLWQSGSFYVKSSGKVVCCGDNVLE